VYQLPDWYESRSLNIETLEPVAVAAYIAGHESTRTTQLYNRMHEELSFDEIEHVHI